MIIAALSDIHGHLPNVPQCDLCLIAGDICPIWDTKPQFNHNEDFQAKWLENDFKLWLKTINAKKIIGIAGNHDKIFQTQPNRIPYLPWTYLQDTGTEFEGLKIWGSPWTHQNADWVFTLPESQLAEKWNLIPNDTDIVVTHNPPYSYGDYVGSNEYIGSKSLLEKIKLIKPKLMVFGHIHEGYGTYNIGNSILANVSVLNDKYRLVNEPAIFEI